MDFIYILEKMINVDKKRRSGNRSVFETVFRGLLMEDALMVTSEKCSEGMTGRSLFVIMLPGRSVARQSFQYDVGHDADEGAADEAGEDEDREVNEDAEVETRNAAASICPRLCATPPAMDTPATEKRPVFFNSTITVMLRMAPARE